MQSQKAWDKLGALELVPRLFSYSMGSDFAALLVFLQIFKITKVRRHSSMSVSLCEVPSHSVRRKSVIKRCMQSQKAWDKLGALEHVPRLFSYSLGSDSAAHFAVSSNIPNHQRSVDMCQSLGVSEAILMSINNIGSYEEISKIIP